MHFQAKDANAKSVYGETAIYSSGSGTDTLTFTYMVQPGDTTPDLQVTGLNLPAGASIVDATGASPSATVSQDLAIRIDTSTSSATSVQQEVMGLYGALYGRNGEFPAYSFWVGYAGAGLNTGNAGSTAVTLAQATTLGQGFVNSQNTFSNQTYGALKDGEFINAMYLNIGGATGDPNGIGYWSGLLAQAETQGQSIQAARAGMVGQFVQVLVGLDTSHRLARLTDQQSADALMRTETISNKIAVSLAYANASNGTGGSILIPAAVGEAAYNAAVKVLLGVTADPYTVAVALADITKPSLIMTSLIFRINPGASENGRSVLTTSTKCAILLRYSRGEAVVKERRPFVRVVRRQRRRPVASAFSSVIQPEARRIDASALHPIDVRDCNDLPICRSSVY